MDWPLAIAIYFICWWLTLFIILPIGVRTQEEEGTVVPGTVESAPANAHIWLKLGATTLVSGLIYALGYWLISSNIITLENIPFLPKLGQEG